ncbi:hypothetical protein [Tenacibaculum aiptasiae]|uniref:hypothetical protein n=1 Tax=Tenacibaculum aiptasiae TaxID=426481 RepID=UPI00232AC6D7|nr:hypothetical protein [Tenacibaculum aiptasiae]
MNTFDSQKLKLKTIILTIGILSLLFGCKKENRYTDKHGNVIIEKGDKTYIIPAEYDKTGISYKIFLRNETEKTVSIKNKFSLKSNEEKIFEFVDTDSILFNIGAKIFFGDTGLEVYDKKGELAGIGGEYWEKYKIPDDVEYGFIIVPIGEGDVITR